MKRTAGQGYWELGDQRETIFYMERMEREPTSASHMPYLLAIFQQGIDWTELL